MAPGIYGLYSPPWPPTLTLYWDFWSLSFGNKIWEQAWDLRFLPFIYEYLLCMVKAVDCHYVMNISQIVENDPDMVRSLRTWGSWDWKAELKASLGRCSGYFSYCCDQIPVKNNLGETGFCGLRVFGDKIHHGRKGITSRSWGTTRKQRDHRLDRISNI